MLVSRFRFQLEGIETSIVLAGQVDLIVLCPKGEMIIEQIGYKERKWREERGITALNT